MIGYNQIEHASLTDVGVRRGHNEDAHGNMLASDPEQWQLRGHIFVVADGMGAHAVGELASKLAIDNVLLAYHKYAHQGAVVALRRAFLEANSTIHARGQQNPEFAGMGTTATTLLLRRDGAWIGHVGDSRAYRIRGEKIEQLTFDHSLVWELARRQHMPPDLVQRIPSNVILRSLGPEPLVQVDIEGPHSVQPGDTFVLCSDGLSGPITDVELGAVCTALPPAEACRFLIDLVNLRGGPDNITLLVVRIGEAAAPPAVPVGKFQWPEWLPFPFVMLFVGIVLAAGAAYLMFVQEGLLGGLALVLAIGTVLAGLVALARSHAEEQRRVLEEPPLREPNIHNSVLCRVDRPLVEKMLRAGEALRKELETRTWNADWTQFEQRTAEAAALLAQGNLPQAFRVSCLAVRVLTEAWHGQRVKEEFLLDAWEKHPSPAA